MEYEINKVYPDSEMANIYQWWETHRQYDINSLEDGGIMITLRDPAIYKLERIEELKNYLSSTDYIVIKLYEAYMNNNEEYLELKNKYASIIQERVKARKEINKLENNL